MVYSSGVDIISKYHQYRYVGTEFFCRAIGNGPVFHAWMFRLLGSQPTFKPIHFEVGRLNIFEIKHFKKNTKQFLALRRLPATPTSQGRLPPGG